MPRKEIFSYVDLFAGCGGLSLGLESAGGNLVFAVEKSSMAAETFVKNLLVPNMSDEAWDSFLDANTEDQLKSKMLVKDIRSVKKNDSVIELLQNLTGPVLIAGGPPCQGFSMAGKRRQDDNRNSLAWDFLDLVDLAEPDFVLIENVPGMNHKFDSQGLHEDSIYAQLANALESTASGYLVQKLQLNAMHYGAPQNRPRLFLLGVKRTLAVKLNLSVHKEIWKSDFADKVSGRTPDLAPTPTIASSEVRTVSNALEDLIHGEKMPDSPFLSEIKNHDYWGLRQQLKLMNTELRGHHEETINKFEIYQLLNRMGLPLLLMKDSDEVQFLQKKAEVLQRIRDNDELIWPLLSLSGDIIARDFEAFRALLEKYKTKKHSQRVLELDSPAPTLISSPDDYIHPTVPRVLSVREYARLQGFSDHFVFHSKVTSGGSKRAVEVPQYTQVGNAVSPYIGLAIGRLLEALLHFQETEL